MGEAKRKKQERAAWPDADHYSGTIDLHVLRSVAAITGARIRGLAGDDTIPETTQVILRAFKAVVGETDLPFGFCLGDGESFSAIGIAVIERLSRSWAARPARLRLVSGSCSSARSFAPRFFTPSFRSDALRFISLAVSSSREDFHLQVDAHAGAHP